MQEFTVPLNTTYKIECWGAQGGSSRAGGAIVENLTGFGAYTGGLISFSKDLLLYVYVGGKGGDAVVGVDSRGGYNGGGSGSWDGLDDESGGGGGGATDVRLVGGAWSDFSSLKSRIIVAAGSGGKCRDGYPGYGGGLNGGNIYKDGEVFCAGGTQTSKNFGKGEDTAGKGIEDGSSGYYAGLGGGGGGYYGGNASWGAKAPYHYYSSGSGGSSFISGYTGCNAISESSTEDNIVHTGQPNHYSGKVFTNPVMIDGASIMPSPSGGTEVGHEGDGYCIITWKQLP